MDLNFGITSIGTQCTLLGSIEFNSRDNFHEIAVLCENALFYEICNLL